MFELTRARRRAGKPMPAQFIVAATDAPHLYWSGPIHIVSTEKLLEGLDMVDVTIDPELPEGLLRADAALLASYMYTPEPPLDVPITAIIGRDDHFVPRGALRGWRNATTGAFTLHEIAADHNLIRKSTDVLAGIVKGTCQDR
jgi:surfactin synthase thioesterase subunit